MRWRAPLWLILAAALTILLLPCFWQPRIVAGDLSSHIYNAWLVELIEEGRAPGLMVVDQHTNVLFDWMLAWLLPRTGPDAAQKLAAAVAVLVFASGAFALVVRVSGRHDLYALPALSVLAYGYVFRMGFMNFYLSLGLCFWALALAWSGTATRALAGALLLPLAWLAHLLPVLWTLGIALYVWAARRLSPRGRGWLFAAAVLALGLLSLAARAVFFVRWEWTQLLQMTGADQAWVYDRKYMVIMLALMAVGSLQFLRLIRQQGAGAVTASVPFQVWAISAALVVITPTAVQGDRLFATFIADRMSLPVAVCAVALLAQAPLRGLVRYALPAVTAAFFAFSYLDERALNRLESRLDRAVAPLAGKRVVSAISLGDTRIEPLRHVADRLCVSRCYSYANYEPSTGEFRVRVSGPNPIVTASYEDSVAMQAGAYAVKEQEAPLFVIGLSQKNRALIHEVGPGGRAPATALPALPCPFC